MLIQSQKARYVQKNLLYEPSGGVLKKWLFLCCEEYDECVLFVLRLTCQNIGSTCSGTGKQTFDIIIVYYRRQKMAAHCLVPTANV